MPDPDLVEAIRERQRQTGERYADARRAVLLERGLPLTTPTSRNAERRLEAAIREEYGDALGIVDPPVRWAPQPRGPRPEIVERRAGRQRRR